MPTTTTTTPFRTVFDPTIRPFPLQQQPEKNHRCCSYYPQLNERKDDWSVSATT